jgi:hypothetical protein
VCTLYISSTDTGGHDEVKYRIKINNSAPFWARLFLDTAQIEGLYI